MKLWALCLAGTMCAATVDEERARALLRQRVVDEQKVKGLVIGIADEKGDRVFAQGEGLNGESIFEIGSLTKVFTAILLAEMAERGEVALDDPVQKFLPEGVTMPVRSGQPVTLRSLAVQSSGLPRLPGNLVPKDGANPYADYTVEQLYDAVRQVKLLHDPLTQYEYSNFGFGLLGEVLARRVGQPFEQLLRERVLTPLRMNDTGIELDERRRARLAPGFTALGRPASNWALGAMAGAGALRSTAQDMLKFLRAQLEPASVPGTLGKAIARAQLPQRPTGAEGLQIAMAWHILTRPVNDPYATRMIWHNGGTGGYRSWAGFRVDNKTAVVVLANTAFSIDDVGRHLLDSGYRVAAHQPNARKRELMVEEAELRKFAGRYRVGGAQKAELVVTVMEGRLQIAAPGQKALRLYAETPERFFSREVEIQVVFGRSGLVLTQGGQPIEAEKVSPLQ